MILEIYTYTKDVRRTSPVTGKPYGARKPLTLRSFHRIPDRVEDDPDNRLLTETRCEPEPIRVIAPGARFLDTPGPTLILTARGEKLTADVALCAARAGLKGLRIDLGPDRSQALPPGRDRILSVILGPPPAEPTAPTTQTGFDWAEPEPKPQALPPGSRSYLVGYPRPASGRAARADDTNRV